MLFGLACGLLAAVVSLAAEYGIVRLMQGLAPDTPPDDTTIETVSTRALFLVMLVLAGLPEETAKLLCLTQILLRNSSAVRGRDAVLLGGFVGLSFGTIENLTTTLLSPDWLVTAAARAVYAVPLHAALGLIGGAIVAASRRGPWTSLAAAVTVVAPLHAAANTVLARVEIVGEATDMRPALAGTLVMLVIWAALRYPVRRMLVPLEDVVPSPGSLAPRRARWSLLLSGFSSLALGLAALLLAAGGVVGSLLHDRGDLVLAPAALLPLAFLEIALPLAPRSGSPAA
jgi:hypothetical protein